MGNLTERSPQKRLDKRIEIHLALDELQPINLPLYLSAAPFIRKRGRYRLVVSSQSPSKVFDLGHFAALRGI